MSVAGLAAAARAINVPYPIVLVIGGAVLAFLPIGLPEVELDPDLVLVIFLPPLLYAGAFFANLADLRANLRPITLAAIGLVLATMVVVAVVAHALIDGLGWPAAFALGAIVGPTDPVAATAIARRLGVPRRLVSVLEGESLINDATALVAYNIAVRAATAWSAFSLLDAGWDFVWKAAGGIAVGLVVGWVIIQIRSRLDDPLIENTIGLLSAYAAYVPAEHLHVSAVLSAVTVGCYVGWQAPRIASPATRLQGFGMWELLQFLMNAFLFVLIGLQLPTVLEALDPYDPLDAGRLRGGGQPRGRADPDRVGAHGRLPGPRARPPRLPARAPGQLALAGWSTPGPGCAARSPWPRRSRCRATSRSATC